jgi:hypothetical protein
VSGKENILFRIAEASLASPEAQVRQVVFPVAGGEQTLWELVHEYRTKGPVFLVLMRWTPEQIIIVLLAAPSLPTTRAAFLLARSSRFTLQTSMIAGRVAP